MKNDTSFNSILQGISDQRILHGGGEKNFPI